MFHLEWRYGGRGSRWGSKSLKTTDPTIAEQLKQDFIESLPPSMTGMKPAEALDGFLDHLTFLKRRPRTIEFYEGLLRPLFDRWGTTPLQKWTRARLGAYVRRRTNWSARTTQMFLNACRYFYRWCEDEGIRCADFVGRLKGPPVRRAERQTLTAEQIQDLLEHCHGHYLELPIALAAYAGLSRADIRSLKWSHVDLKAGRIAKPRSKTRTKIRTPIIPQLLKILSRRRALSGPVCRDLPASDSSLLKALHRQLAASGIPPAPRGHNGWHRFRHSVATILGQLRVPIPVIGLILSHTPGSTVTLEYVHADEGQVRDAMEAYSNELRRVAT